MREECAGWLRVTKGDDVARSFEAGEDDRRAALTLIQDPAVHVALNDYAAQASLAPASQALRDAAARFAPALRGRTVWMINSTAAGGGVAELLPGHISLLRELGVDVRWAVIESNQPEFFELTKRLHNLIHALPQPHPTENDRALFESVSRKNADLLKEFIKAGDILVVHDPQPVAVGAVLATELGIPALWRCHIGVDEDTEHTRAAWNFLAPYFQPYRRMVFSVQEYVPPALTERSRIIHPTIDPLSHKNRSLSLHKMVGILCDSGLAVSHWPLVAPPWEFRAQRLQPDGSFAEATRPDDIGLIARPIVTQVSRWDRLKGFAPLLDGFALLKTGKAGGPQDERHQNRLAACRLVLAGPAADSVQDDPEAISVLDGLCEQYRALPPEVQRDVAIVTLPMQSRKYNALMVNALQRSSDIVVQNSLQEGFGLTVAEAMWKRKPILGSTQAHGVRLQVRDGIDGRLIDDPADPAAIARVLHDMFTDSDRLEIWGRNAQHRVNTEFLVLTELQAWLEELAALAAG